MNELVLQSCYENKAQMKTNNSYNPGMPRYKDDSFDEITAIICIYFLFCRCNVRGNKVHANPSTLLLLLILILLRYSKKDFHLGANNTKYVEVNDYNENIFVRDKEAKDDCPYLGGYESGYSDNPYSGGYEGGHEQKHEVNFSESDNNGLTESDSTEQVIFSGSQEIEVSKGEIVDLNIGNIKEIVEEFLNKEKPKDENNEDDNNEDSNENGGNEDSEENGDNENEVNNKENNEDESSEKDKEKITRESSNSLALMLKDDYFGANVTAVVANSSVVTGEVVFKVNDIISLKTKDRIIFINEKDILSSL